MALASNYDISYSDILNGEVWVFTQNMWTKACGLTKISYTPI